MSRSLIRKNQLHPDINDLVGQYGSGYFPSKNSTVFTTGNQTIGGKKTFTTGIVSPLGIGNPGDVSDAEIRLWETSSESYQSIGSVDGGFTFTRGGIEMNLEFNSEEILLAKSPGIAYRFKSGYNGTVPIDANVVHVSGGNETISGVKTFATGIFAPNLVYNTGNQTISGVKTFASRPTFNGTGVLVSGDSAPAIAANYITVTVTNNSVDNGTNLLQAYTRAKTTLPNGNALSATNRLAIILPPAIYDLGTQSLILDTQYIDIVGSTPDRSKHHIKSNVGEIDRGTVQQTANNVKLYNLTIENINNTYSRTDLIEDPAAYFPTSNLNNTYLENINFIGNASVFPMRVRIEYSGTYINCTGGDYAFGGIGTASGTFTNCTGGDYSFCGDGVNASGTFTNCTGGNYAFGGDGGTASGTFKDCTGGIFAFGGDGSAPGIFTNCTGGEYAFGGNGSAIGTFTNCTGGDNAFGGDGGTANGTFTNCTGAINTFGGFGTASGTFTNCTGGNFAFGGDGGTASGTFKDCTGGDTSFGGGSGGVATGTFTNCRGGSGSFNL